MNALMNKVRADAGTCSVGSDEALIGTVLDSEQVIAEVLPEWQMLADRVATAGLFVQPAVWQSWYRSIGKGSRPTIITVREAGRLLGVWPFMIRRALRGPTLGVRYDYEPTDRRWLRHSSRRWVPVRQISPVLSLPATMLGPMLLAEPERRAAVIRAVAKQVVGLRGWDVAVIPVDQAEVEFWSAAFTAAGAHSAVQPLNRMDFSLTRVKPFDTVISSQPQKFRANVRRARVAADRAGLLVYVTADLPLAQSHLAHLAAESWKAHDRDGQVVIVPYAGPQQMFFESLMSADHAPRSVIATVMQGDAPVAITFGAMNGDMLTTLLTFWNGLEAKASPGLLSMAAMINWGAQNGASRIDFNSNSPWLRYLTDTVTLQQNLLVFAPNLRGRLLAGLSRASIALLDRWKGFGAVRKAGVEDETLG